MGNVGWRDRALCSTDEEAPDFFDQSAKGRATAKNFCKPCPVKGQCLEYAMKIEEGYSKKIITEGCGVWGGKDGYERVSIRNARKQAKEG